jgi:DNA-binding transcriptional LysR family regulator
VAVERARLLPPLRRTVAGQHVNANWLADQLARLHVRYPGLAIVLADTRRHAED